MLVEDLRLIHEDNERLEEAIADRFRETPRHVRDRLSRDHQIAGFLDRTHVQSKRALEIYKDDSLLREIQSIGTGDTFEEFYDRLKPIKDFHKRYPNEPVENLERAYKRRAIGEDTPFQNEQVDTMFSGEEAFGRFFDLLTLQEQFVNLPGVRRINYMQYIEAFDNFDQIPKPDKMREQYFTYVNSLAQYLESFMRRTKPLEDLDKLFATWDREFEAAWDADQIVGWQKDVVKDGPVTEGSGEGVWCSDCEKEFKNDSVYRAHLTGKKHIRAAEARKDGAHSNGMNGTNGTKDTNSMSMQRLKERAVAERESRIKKLASAMQTERSDTRVNVERKQGMTEKERAQELEALYDETTDAAGVGAEDQGDDEDKIYNPLKLPLAWDGKPIPFWLYKLHGLGVEFPCEICGNFVYMGRRAFDKHFSEARHLYGLKCLGINNTSSLFREITGIEEAKALWAKIDKDKRTETAQTRDVVQMEDSEGNVMPEKVYYDLQKQGLL